jgi:hypothetical protein
MKKVFVAPAVPQGEELKLNFIIEFLQKMIQVDFNIF